MLYGSLPLLAIALWVLVAWGIRKEQAGRRPDAISATITRDLKRREAGIASLDKRAPELIQWINKTSGRATGEWIGNLPFYVYAYRDDSLIAWSTTTVQAPQLPDGRPGLFALSNGSYYGQRMQRSWLPPGTSLFLLFPIRLQYPYSNEYLQTEFAASRAIDPHVIVTDTAVRGAAPLKAPDGRQIGWVHPPPPDDLPEPPPNWIVWCMLLSLVLVAVWLHSWLVRLAGRSGLLKSSALVVAVAVCFRLLLKYYGLPFRISETDLFSPRLYA